MNTAHLAEREFRFDQKSFWRDPGLVFVSIGMPLLYLFIFASVFGSGMNSVGGTVGAIKGTAYYVAGIIAIGVISATFNNLVSELVEARESGNLKRLRSTPLPTVTFITGYVGSAMAIAFLVSALVMVLGRTAYGVPIPSATMPALIVTILVAGASFSCLAFAFTLAVANARTAAPTVVAVTLFLFFISGNFFSIAQAPAAFRAIANLFPVHHFNTALWTVFNPHTTGAGFQWGDLGIIALWGLAGILIAVRFFRWKPTGDE